MKPGAKPVVGWREWVSLPELGIGQIKAKIDTGARSSSLHVFRVEMFRRDGKTIARFRVHPRQRDSTKTRTAEAEVVEERLVKSSSGHRMQRPVIVTDVEVMGQTWPIEITLANRDEMGFRMLLGRQALRGRFLVDAGRSYYGKRPKRRRETKRRLMPRGKGR